MTVIHAGAIEDAKDRLHEILCTLELVALRVRQIDDSIEDDVGLSSVIGTLEGQMVAVSDVMGSLKEPPSEA